MKPRPGFVLPATAVPSYTAAAAPLRRPAVRLLAGLRLAGGYRVGCSTTPERDNPAHWLCLSCYRRPASADFCPWLAWSRAARRLRRQLRTRLRRLPQGWLARGARLHSGRPGVNRKRLNITAHYPKPLRLPQQSCSRLGPLRALRVRVMVCYVLRPQPSSGVIRRCAWVQSALRDGWPTPNRGAALPRLPARSLAGCAGQPVGGCRPRTTFGFRYPCPYTSPIALRGLSRPLADDRKGSVR